MEREEEEELVGFLLLQSPGLTAPFRMWPKCRQRGLSPGDLQALLCKGNDCMIVIPCFRKAQDGPEWVLIKY